MFQSDHNKTNPIMTCDIFKPTEYLHVSFFYHHIIVYYD